MWANQLRPTNFILSNTRQFVRSGSVRHECACSPHEHTVYEQRMGLKVIKSQLSKYLRV